MVWDLTKSLLRIDYMNFIVITEKDAANVSVGRISNELIRRGHNVRVFYPYNTESLTRDFDDSIELCPLNEIDEDTLTWCNAVFMTSIAADYIDEKILKLNKPIFTQSYLLNGQVDWGGDCRFVSSIESSAMEYEYVFSQMNVAVGEPKYDLINSDVCLTQNKKFLFIDSGHFPFGEKGKRQLAKCLLSICERYPDYDLIIKPRFLPTDKIVTHRNLFTLYDALLDESKRGIPTNLIYLKQHYDLITLIEQCEVVLCLYTSSYVGACVAKKGLIILEGFDSDDVYDLRKKHFDYMKRMMEHTGALIDYHDVFEYLPGGVRTKDNEMIKIVSEYKNVAEKICEMIEHLYTNYYSQNLFPEAKTYEYRNYKDKMLPKISSDWDSIIKRRLKNYIYRQCLIHISFRISKIIDISLVQQYVEGIDYSHIDLSETLKKGMSYRYNCIIQNKTCLYNDNIDSGILLNALYINEEYDEIIKFKNRNISAYYLFSGCSYEKMGDLVRARNSLETYFVLTRNRQYILEITDMSDNRFWAFDLLIGICINTRDLDKARYYYSELETYYKMNYLSDDVITPPSNAKQMKNYKILEKYRNI